ncbi:hypothetical protein ACLOJK_038219 [Asimina triloba]
MDKKQGFFSSLKDEVVRGLSPSRSRSRSRSKSPMSGIVNRMKNHCHVSHPGPLIPRSGILRPVIEGPDPDGDGGDGRKDRRGHWMRGQLSRAPSVSSSSSSAAVADASATYNKRSDLRLLLGVMGAPLAPVHVSSVEPLPHLSIKDTPIIARLVFCGNSKGNLRQGLGGDSHFVLFEIAQLVSAGMDCSWLREFSMAVAKRAMGSETSSAQYILQQYTAASGGQKLQNSIRNAYAMGKVKMVASEFETATKVTKNRSASRSAESGGFVLWQMTPDMWYVELAVGGMKVHAGCNGKLVWRHTPWLGVNAAKGPVRPLRRALQGLDPRTTASMFADARCIGEKKVCGEECFILKLCADPQTLRARSEGAAEIIRHVLFGYFSQKTGLLVQMEDSHLTRIQANSGDAVYWETTINSFLDDYRPVDGIMIAHSGRSVVTLFKFGEMAMSHTKTRMEEVWTIEEVAFNIPGLSMDCFIPPADIRCDAISETCELPHGERGKPIPGSYRSKVAAVDKPHDNQENVSWKIELRRRIKRILQMVCDIGHESRSDNASLIGMWFGSTAQGRWSLVVHRGNAPLGSDFVLVEDRRWKTGNSNFHSRYIVTTVSVVISSCECIVPIRTSLVSGGWRYIAVEIQYFDHVGDSE